MADIDLKVTIKENQITRVKSGFHGMANNKMQLTFESVSMNFEYSEKQNGETEKQFAERVLRELGKLLLTTYEMNKDYLERYEPEIKAVLPPEVNIPDDLLS